MKAYLVEGRTGTCHDDASDWLVAVYFNEQLAEAHVSLLETWRKGLPVALHEVFEAIAIGPDPEYHDAGDTRYSYCGVDILDKFPRPVLTWIENGKPYKKPQPGTLL